MVTQIRQVVCAALTLALSLACGNSALALESSKFAERTKRVASDSSEFAGRSKKVSFDAAGVPGRAKQVAGESSKFSGRAKREAFAKSCEFDEKGIALEEQGKFKEAIEQYKMAIATYPSYSVHYCNLGNALADLKRYSEAIVQYKKAVELSPDFAAAYCNMADAMSRQKDYMAAELACKSAIRVDPGYVPAMTNLAEVYLSTNRPHDAITVLNKAGGLTTTASMKKLIAEDLEKANQMFGTDSPKVHTFSSLERMKDREPVRPSW